jgi:malonyl-CoA O-methyltransferase
VQAYDRWSASYDHDHNATRDLDAVILRQRALPVDGATVIEFGAGTGKNSEWLAGRARRLLGLDFSIGMLSRARSRVPGATFIVHDIREPWPIASGAADLVVGNLVLEHVEHLGPVLSECARVLRTGGVLACCELHPFRQWRGGQAHFTGDDGETVHVPAFTHSVADYLNAAIACGFRLAHVGEWVEPTAPDGTLPRLLSMEFVLAPPSVDP